MSYFWHNFFYEKKFFVYLQFVYNLLVLKKYIV